MNGRHRLLTCGQKIPSKMHGLRRVHQTLVFNGWSPCTLAFQSTCSQVRVVYKHLSINILKQGIILFTCVFRSLNDLTFAKNGAKKKEKQSLMALIQQNIFCQSHTQRPQPAVGHQDRLLGAGILEFSDWLPCNPLALFYCRNPAVSVGACTLSKQPVDSGYEIDILYDITVLWHVQSSPPPTHYFSRIH